MGVGLNHSLAVVNCSQVLTLAGPARARVGPELQELSAISNGALLIRGSRIEQAGKREEIEKLITSEDQVIDAGGRTVLPGFVDAHAHPVFAGNRADEFEERSRGVSYQEIAARGGGIKSTVRSTREATSEELYESGKRYAEWFLRCGTTTVEAKSGYGLTLDDELKILRVIRQLDQDLPLRYVPTFLGAHDVPSEFIDRREEYVELVTKEMLPDVAKEELAEYCDVFCEAKVFSLVESRKILTAARNLGLGLRIHADQLSLSGGANLAAELKATTADHLEHTNAEGIAALQKSGVQPVLLPGSVYALGSSRYPAAREMIAAGLGVVLATDFNPGSSPTPSMLQILSLAATHLKLTPAESITATTINAAYSLNRGKKVGSLEAGKSADFVIHDCSDYRELSYFFGIEHPWQVYVGGRLAFSRA